MGKKLDTFVLERTENALRNSTDNESIKAYKKAIESNIPFINLASLKTLVRERFGTQKECADFISTKYPQYNGTDNSLASASVVTNALKGTPNQLGSLLFYLLLEVDSFTILNYLKELEDEDEDNIAIVKSQLDQALQQNQMLATLYENTVEMVKLLKNTNANQQALISKLLELSNKQDLSGLVKVLNEEAAIYKS